MVRHPHRLIRLLVVIEATYNDAMEISGSIEVIPATLEHKTTLANLLELYIHDFTELIAFKVGEDGRFGYPDLSLYWTEPGRHPFLIRVDDHWAGFVLVRRGSQVSGDEDVWDMTEFFVLRGYRRLGVGTEVAHDIWRRFPGNWEVRVIELNQRALSFWREAIAAFLGEPLHSSRREKGAKAWQVFSFESAEL
jgi:predicted acetyltransferase